MIKPVGLKRGIVKLVEHNTAWALAFQREKKKIEKIFNDEKVVIQHIGSTAIQGIPAKPVIDMLVGLASVKDTKKYIKKLENVGYIFRPNFRRPDQHLLFAKGNDRQRTHHIHVIKYKGAVWKRLTLFRDYLNTHPGRAKQYARLKTTLAKKFAQDRREYTLAKGEFIKKTVELAKKRLK